MDDQIRQPVPDPVAAPRDKTAVNQQCEEIDDRKNYGILPPQKTNVMKSLRTKISWLLMSLLSASLIAGESRVPPQQFKDGDTPPKPIKREPPVYPYNMRSAGLAGKVLVEFVIDSSGNVVNPVVVSSNNPWFERPAIEAILKWRFTPAQVGGRKVNTRASQLLEFSPGQSSAGNRGLWVVPRPKNPEKLPPELRWNTAPQPVKSAFPVYPFPSLQAGLTGLTEINFIVGPNGTVIASELVSASSAEMGQSVLAMIDAWQFTPPKDKAGLPCHAALRMKHDFKPNAGDAPVPAEARQILRILKENPEDIIALKDLDLAIKPLSRRQPVYPTKLLKAGLSGNAVIEFFIDKFGDAQLPHIISSSEPEFGYAAAQAVATWRFEQPKKKGKPVVVRVRIPIEFARGGS